MQNYPNDPTTRAGQPYPNTGQMPPPPGYSQPGYPPQGPYPGPQFTQQPGYPPGYQPQQPIQPPKKKKGKALWIVLGIIVGAIVLCGVIATATGGKSSPTTTPSPSGGSNSNATQQQQAPPPKAQTWTTTHTFTGTGAKKTETFQVGNDWKIQWTCQGVDGLDAPLFVSVYNSDGTSVDLNAVSTTCKAAGAPTTDSTEERQGGNVYLDVNAGISWTLTIQEQK